MKRILVAILVLLLTACEKPAPIAISTINNTSPSIAEDTTFTILDIRKRGECEEQTLMEREDKFRISRCGYFGKVGDRFIFVE